MDDPVSWNPGHAVIEQLIREGRVKKRQTFDTAMNQESVDALRVKLTSVDMLIDTHDYESAVSIAHEVVRKGLTALLRAQGLDIGDVVGSHRTVEEAALAQFGASGQPLFAVRHGIRELRTLRHDSEYRSEITEILEEDAQDARETASVVHAVATKLISHLGVFR